MEPKPLGPPCGGSKNQGFGSAYSITPPSNPGKI
jgi:hypothetical protein